MIEISRLTKTFSGASELHALHDVSLTIDDGEIYGIIGASGAGKSTLVRCINLLERPTRGRIIIDGVDVTDYQGRQLNEFRSSIGMIFQDFSLFQQRSVLGNVTFPLELRHDKKEHREQRARKLLSIVGLTDKESSYPSQLSGGQQQRVAIARALANNPKIMLCDEATSALDTRTTASILSLLKSINKDLGVTMIIITHSLSVASKICDKIAVIDEGKVVESGVTSEVFSCPKSPITRELLNNDSLKAEEG
ncbi:MAG: ATP-binding cassette domain-containing protein [Coriobacteriales bacterium]|nr:ATP-binding cassette domain-containing protein [Coriobacteriales bacterium]